MTRKLNDAYVVQPLGDDWAIRRLQSPKTIETFDLQSDAIDRAAELMRNNNAPFVIRVTRSGGRRTQFVNWHYLSSIDSRGTVAEAR